MKHTYAHAHTHIYSQQTMTKDLTFKDLYLEVRRVMGKKTHNTQITHPHTHINSLQTMTKELTFENLYLEVQWVESKKTQTHKPTSVNLL